MPNVTLKRAREAASRVSIVTSCQSWLARYGIASSPYFTERGFFICKDLVYTYVNRVTRCFSEDIAWITWIFSCPILFGAYGTTLHRVFHGQCCPRSIKTTLYRIFPMQCSLEPLGQHWIGFWPMQLFSPIKRRLNRTFYHSMFSWAAIRTILYRILKCAMLC